MGYWHPDADEVYVDDDGTCWSYRGLEGPTRIRCPAEAERQEEE